MKFRMLLLQDKELIKNAIKRGGQSACFHAGMLTNTIIWVTFSNLRAQQISSITFTCICSVLHHIEFDFLWLFIHLRPQEKNVVKYAAIFYPSKETIWTCGVGPVISQSPSVVFFS